MEFFEAAANWADRRYVVVTFERDEFDGWYARLQFSDARGPFSKPVNLMMRGPKEDREEFACRVEKAMETASVAARQSRLPRLAARAA